MIVSAINRTQKSKNRVKKKFEINVQTRRAKKRREKEQNTIKTKKSKNNHLASKYRLVERDISNGTVVIAKK